MKKKLKKWISFLMAAVLFVSLSGVAETVSGAESRTTTEAEVSSDIEATISGMVSAMTTKEKIAQMIMPAFRNYNGEKVTELPQDIKDFLEKYPVAGVCLFAENFSDTEQSVRLVDELQSAVKPGSPQLFLSADQEGGRITRLNTGTQMPGNMALAATGDENNAKEAAKVIGTELHAIGINTDFAPVIDVNNNPSNPIIGLRSFSDDPETVARFGKAYLEGLSETGTIGTVKHFPGHGDTATDSHTGLPCISKTYEELKKLELIPYERCLDSVDMLMIAHIQYPAIEKEIYYSPDGREFTLPATLSKKIITDILRKDLKYDGVVTTDAMDMDAIASNFGRQDAEKLAIEAGVDILLMPVRVEDAYGLADLEAEIDIIAGLVTNKRISEERIDESVKRILRLKSKKGLLTPYASGNLQERIDEAKSKVGCKENHDLEWAITKKAITLVKNDDNTLPIDTSGGKTVILNHDSDYTLSTQFALQKLKETEQVSSEVQILTDTFADKEISQIKELVKDAKNVIMDIGIGSKAKLNPENNSDITKIRETIGYVHENGGRVTVISYSLPYDVGLYQDADAVIAAYSARGMTSLPGEFPDYTVQYGANVPAALYMCMTSKESTTGVLPVNIPKITEEYDFSDKLLYERGYGLTYISEPVDYGREENWAYNGIGEGKKADVFLICPTVDTKSKYNMPLKSSKLRKNFVNALEMERGIYENEARLFAPYYRQASLPVYQMSATEREKYLEYAYQDISQAFRYYLENENDGRPVILAGFSQGADMCLRILKEYFESSENREKLVATYAIGWSVTKDMVDEYPQIVPASTETDYGTIVSFDCEAETVTGSAVIGADEKAISINPLNWRTDSVPADKSLNKGACFMSGAVVEKEEDALCGCYIDEKRGALKVTDIQATDYDSTLGGVFPAGSYHIYDYQFFYRNLQENVGKRLAAYLAGKSGEKPETDPAEDSGKELQENAGKSQETQLADKSGQKSETNPTDDSGKELGDLAKNGKVTGLKKSYVYTGKGIKPQFKVVYGGNNLVSGKDYKVSCLNNKNVGNAVVKITGIGSYSGTLKAGFQILPEGTKIVKAKREGTKLYIIWDRKKTQVTGYEIRYSAGKNFKASVAKKVIIKKNSTTKKTIGNIKKGETYFVKIRTYKENEKKKYYSAWSGVKKAA